MSASSSPRNRLRLVQHLRAAHHVIVEWEKSLREVSPHAATPPHDAASLLALLHETRCGIEHRLAELGETLTLEDTANVVSEAAAESKETEGLCVRACRSCGRIIGAAFREAQRVADAASARILYGSLRALEKQLWVLEPRLAG